MTNDEATMKTDAERDAAIAALAESVRAIAARLTQIPTRMRADEANQICLEASRIAREFGKGLNEQDT